jgi:hypothetical protein
MTYEITPDRTVASSADIHYPAATVQDIYRIARDIATAAGIDGHVYVGGTHVIAGNTLIARVRYCKPWYTIAGDKVATVFTATGTATLPV